MNRENVTLRRLQNGIWKHFVVAAGLTLVLGSGEAFSDENSSHQIADLDAVFVLNPSREDLQLCKGLTLLEAGRLPEAVESLNRHLSVHAEDGFAWIELARAMVILQPARIHKEMLVSIEDLLVATRK